METIKILGEELLTVEEVSKLLSLTVQTVREKYGRGELQRVQIGRKYYIPKSSVMNYLAGVTGRRPKKPNSKGGKDKAKQ